MYELAAAAGADPLEFRLKYLDPNDKRSIELLERLNLRGHEGTEPKYTLILLHPYSTDMQLARQSLLADRVKHFQNRPTLLRGFQCALHA